MKHYDFVTAIKLRDFYKEKLIGLPLHKEIPIPIIRLIACVAGTQQNYVDGKVDLDIDDQIESEQRLMNIYVVVAYGKFREEFLFTELHEVLAVNGLIA